MTRKYDALLITLLISALAACAQHSATNIYKAPEGITAASGAVITGFAGDPTYINENRKADRDFACISAIDHVAVASFKLSIVDPLLHRAGTDDPTHCQSLSGFPYNLAPGHHVISVAYWDLDAFRWGYALPADFEISVQAGQTLRVRRQESGWSKTKLWIEDGAGTQVGEARQVQYEGRYTIEFGQLNMDQVGILIPRLTSDPIYAGPPLSSISVDLKFDTRFGDLVDGFRDHFAAHLKECGATGRVRTVIFDDKGAPASTQEVAVGGAPPQSFDAKLLIAEHGFNYYKERGLFQDPDAGKQHPVNTLIDASLVIGNAKTPDWQSGVEIFGSVGVGVSLADAFIGRLSDDGYLRGCPEMPKWDRHK